MIRILSILQWVLLLAIWTAAFWHSYRAGRNTLFAGCFTWFMMLADHASGSAWTGSAAPRPKAG
jgi:hypothetical protein